MPQAPHPPGWKGGSESFGFQRTFDGHIGINPLKDEEGIELTDRSNVRWGVDDADLSNYGDSTQ